MSQHIFKIIACKAVKSMLLMATIGFMHAAHAGVTMVVNSADDGAPAPDGKCTLREAVLSANQREYINKDCIGSGDWNGKGADEIIISVDESLIKLTHYGPEEDQGETGDLDIHVDLNINVKADQLLQINGLHSDRIFDIHGPIYVGLNKLTLSSGQPPHEDKAIYGGAIRAMDWQSTLTLNDCIVTRNRLIGSGSNEVAGGGIASRGTVNLNRSEVSHNLVYSPLQFNPEFNYYEATGSMGGGIAMLDEGIADQHLAMLFIKDSRIVANTVMQLGPNSWKNSKYEGHITYTRGTQGGGIYGEYVYFDIRRTEIADNIVENLDAIYGHVRGGGISIVYLDPFKPDESILDLQNVTVSNNKIILHSLHEKGRPQGGGIATPRILASITNSSIVFNRVRAPKSEIQAQADWVAGGYTGISDHTYMLNSILALNYVGEDEQTETEANCDGILLFPSWGYNIFGAVCESGAETDTYLFDSYEATEEGQKEAVKKLSLLPLADNGGKNTLTANPRTHALGFYFESGQLIPSIAIDKGSKDCVDVDQRGFSRPAFGWQWKICDVGAYELNAKP